MFLFSFVFSFFVFALIFYSLFSCFLLFCNLPLLCLFLCFNSHFSFKHYSVLPIDPSLALAAAG
ncbi:MAG TPA: hypothetical protein DCQ73_08115 [Spirochaetaceae bacterium]|nr:hypothetical protein [Spirochaetaceae bacterium]HAX38034.1 hypothetical protein [Spirochaetaceae bacterium]